eukprot:gnl/TRDRNA2_/TRDRNA2_186796_c0_seq1.p1 gnl/TRDRNA2_/TRDRNA2_186796_c0~~gnl/TRDRNA2_/TRDRNA2_186796_c0_seq1.p1  ORF type:complete len:234 (+),score=29.66 gnl/TRDRNA2_/TRDRNA2_186796_c0_seq1:57-758(+)
MRSPTLLFVFWGIALPLDVIAIEDACGPLGDCQQLFRKVTELGDEESTLHLLQTKAQLTPAVSKLVQGDDDRAQHMDGIGDKGNSDDAEVNEPSNVTDAKLISEAKTQNPVSESSAEDSTHGAILKSRQPLHDPESDPHGVLAQLRSGIRTKLGFGPTPLSIIVLIVLFPPIGLLLLVRHWNFEYEDADLKPTFGMKSCLCCLFCTPFTICYPIDVDAEAYAAAIEADKGNKA